MSRKIHALEEFLGLKLIRNIQSGLELTEDGMLALSNFMPLVKAHEEDLENQKRKVSMNQKSLHIVAPIGYSISTVHDAMYRFQKDFRKVDFWLERFATGWRTLKVSEAAATLSLQTSEGNTLTTVLN